MEDDEIRAVLRELGEVKFGTPQGHLSVPLAALDPRGIDGDEAVRWVNAHGGYVDRTEYVSRGLGANYGRRQVDVRLIVPEAALRE